MRYIYITLFLIFAPLQAFSLDIENSKFFGKNDAEVKIQILSTADIEFFAPMINSFLEEYPNFAINYIVASSTELFKEIKNGDHKFDLVISSAMDLQTKLVNDGYAITHFPKINNTIPDWSTWNNRVFAFTQEPAAIVISNEVFKNLSKPKNRQEVISLLRNNSSIFKERLGTYDVRTSGLGYLFATQDARASETYWRLTEVMGSLNTKLYCCSSDMIDAVESGELALAYNVLGSYALGRESDKFTIILPEDSTTVMLRSIFITINAEHPNEAGIFIDHLLRKTYIEKSSPISSSEILTSKTNSDLNRIRLGTGLLVYLDQLKYRSFIREWENSILQN